MSIREIMKRNKHFIPHFFGLYILYFIILSAIFTITETPFIVTNVPLNLGEQPIALFFVASIVPLVLTFYLMNIYSSLQEQSPRLAKYTPFLLILYIGYLVVLFFHYLWLKPYLSSELGVYLIIYGILAVIPILLFYSLYYWRKISQLFRLLESKIILGTFLFLMYQLFLNFLLFSVLSLQIPEGIDTSVFYGMLDPDVFSGSEEAQFNLLVSIFLIFNIVCNVLVGWLSWKWRQREDLSQTVVYWSIGFFCFGIVDLVINFVILHFEPTFIQEALVPWMGLVLLLGLDFYLFLVITVADILKLISSIPILGSFYNLIQYGYFLAILVIMLFSIVLFPLMSVGFYYIGFGLKNFWEKRKRNLKLDTNEIMQNFSETEY